MRLRATAAAIVLASACTGDPEAPGPVEGQFTMTLPEGQVVERQFPVAEWSLVQTGNTTYALNIEARNAAVRVGDTLSRVVVGMGGEAYRSIPGDLTLSVDNSSSEGTAGIIASAFYADGYFATSGTIRIQRLADGEVQVDISNADFGFFVLNGRIIASEH